MGNNTYDPSQVKCTWGDVEFDGFATESDNIVGESLTDVTFTFENGDIEFKIDNDNLEKLKQLINKQEDKC